ncbi:type I-E CRISPR-associated protein Cas6/Cse3/CasE [Streptomyces sp. SHP 1-2]|uniref:type I-E CRISPR-associated protein Cas6/Cse3/CasE n=1 Tax=Streptomyces sp. SHP 1-2 TaxID=2769489 RepID=UPI0022379702|nr:type I-E CRISPR-associated protein Cas6/Cse3/CasE [Streptomyces sp. SHP 1-2]MCW5250141.1 type I-E CRISPR-associated protein Cas6/Cse3/CasE [Streptomyces sp. SHP 1-2]
MYLTRFRINTGRSEARRLLGSPHRLHGAVNMAFPDPPARDGTGPRVLWRLDGAPGGRVDLLISSPDRPDLTHLTEQAGWPSLGQDGWTTFAYGEFLAALAEGDTWAFRLTANPVHHIRRAQDPVGAPTKRAAHVTPRHQARWLLRQQERCGFAVLREPAADFFPTPPGSGAADRSPVPPAEDRDAFDTWVYELVVHDRAPVRFGRGPGGERGTPGTSGRRSPQANGSTVSDVRFTRATFDGRLRITDLTAFRRTLTQGVGKAKAYGCGLMTLAPGR